MVSEKIKKISDWIEKHEIILIILCGVVLLRLPGLFEPNRYADEDIYLTIGQGLARGGTLYRDIFDNKTPLIYLTAMVAGNVMWFRLILMIWNSINVVVIWKLAEKLIENKRGVILATVLFAIFSTIPLLEGEIANGEMFMIMPAAAAVYLLLSKTGGVVSASKNYFFSGALFALAFLFKVPVAVELFGVVFFILFWKRIVDRRLWFLLFGFGLPVAMSLIYYYSVGVGEIYLRSALLQNISYLSSWGGGGGGSIFSGSLTTRGLIMIFSLIVIWLVRNKVGDKFSLIFVWAVTALFGALLSGRPYPHYLLEIVGPSALLVAICLTKRTAYTAVLGLLFVTLVVVSVRRYDFWYYKSLPYYINFIDYIRGGKTKDQYYSYWGSGVLANYRAASYIKRVTSEDEKIFVWGTEPAIYALSNRALVGKYTVAYHVLDFSAKRETGELLIREKPKVIVVVENERKSFPEMAGLLVSDYVLTEKFENLKIYLLIK